MKRRMRKVVPLLAPAAALLLCMVMEPAVPAAAKKTALSVQLRKKKLTLKVGETAALKAKVKPAKAKISWKSSKPKVASVSSKGKVTAKTSGTAKITVKARYKKKTKKATCTVVVKKSFTHSISASPSICFRPTQTPQPSATPSAVLVQQIVTGQDAYTAEVGKAVSLGASVLPETATNKTLTYVCDNPAVAAVDEKGQVQPLKEGTANITVQAADGSQVKKVVQVNVIAPVTSIEQETIELKIGEKYKLEPDISPAGSTLHSCNVSNTKDYVASVAEDGEITAKYPGITNVTVSSALNPEVSCRFRVQVTDDFTAPDGFDQYDETIKHGELVKMTYESVYRPRGIARAIVWLPPEYDGNKQYNLLFCLHGGNDNERYWTSDSGGLNDGCSADKVLDNAYAKGLIEDTIVVFTSGVINYDAEKEYPNVVENPLLTDFWKNHFLLEFEIINVLLPLMQQQYPLMTGPEHTGICGLSMGCGQTMEIGLKHPDMFGYVGCYSAGPFEKADQPFVRSEEDAAELNEKLKLLFFITGENDHMMDDSMRNFIKTCDGFGLNHVFYEVPGRGHDDPCWDRCLYAFMKYAFK